MCSLVKLAVILKEMQSSWVRMEDFYTTYILWTTEETDAEIQKRKGMIEIKE